jgi:hypothetical protein
MMVFGSYSIQINTIVDYGSSPKAFGKEIGTAKTKWGL